MLTPVWNYSFPGWKWMTQTRKHLMLKSIFYIQHALKLHKMLLPRAIFVFWDCSSNPQVFPSGLGAAACSLGMKNSRKSSETLLQWHTLSSKHCWFLNSADIKQLPPHGLGPWSVPWTNPKDCIDETYIILAITYLPEDKDPICKI